MNKDNKKMNLSRLEKVKLNIDLQLVILRYLLSSVNAANREEMMNNFSKLQRHL
jgi:hypothetical protein